MPGRQWQLTSIRNTSNSYNNSSTFTLTSSGMSMAGLLGKSWLIPRHGMMELGLYSIGQKGFLHGFKVPGGQSLTTSKQNIILYESLIVIHARLVLLFSEGWKTEIKDFSECPKERCWTHL